MIIINSKELLDSIAIAKPMKPDIIFFNGGEKIYSTNESLSYLKLMRCDIPLKTDLSFPFNKQVNTFLKKLEDVPSHQLDISNDIPLMPPKIFIGIIEKVASEIANTQFTKEYRNLKEDINFLNCINVKAIDGLQMYIKDNYIMSLFTGLLPINKTDSVDLNIYDIDNYNFIAHFIITKKKNQILDVFIRYMKV